MRTVNNVQRFGAVGDGVTDDTVAIQAAIDNLGTTGGAITGPLGTYLISKQGAVSHDSVTPGYCLKIGADATHGPITLDFPRGTVFKLKSSQAANSVMLLLDGASTGYRTAACPTTIRGITWDGNQANQTAWTDHGLITTLYSREVLIEQCSFKNAYMFGVHILRDSVGVRVRDNYFDSLSIPAEGTGASVRAETQDVTIENNSFVCDALAGRCQIDLSCNADIDLQGRSMTVTRNYISGGYNGQMIALGGVTNCVVTHNVIRDQTDAAGFAISLAAYSNANGTFFDCSHNVVAHNQMYNCRQGIQLSSSTGTVSSTRWIAAANNNLIAYNQFTRYVEDLKTQIGAGDTFPDFFSQAPNAASVNLANAIKSLGTIPTVGSLASGTATAGGGSTLTDSGKSFTVNGLTGYLLVITGGTGKGQVRGIASNTGTVITVTTAWDVTPDTTSTYACCYSAGYNQIVGNKCWATNNSTVMINESNFLPDLIVDNEAFNTTAAFTYGTAGTSNTLVRMRGNRAYSGQPNSITGNAGSNSVIYADEGRGTSAIPNAATSVAVTHRLGRTPAVNEISLTMTNSPTNDPGYLYVSATSSTTFTVNCRADPGASTATFAWAVNGVDVNW